MSKKLVVWLKDVDKDDVGLVGGKGANLGEMIRAGFPVPNGFIVTAPAYFLFIKESNLQQKIDDVLKNVDYKNTKNLETASQKIRHLILREEVPKEIVSLVFKYYRVLGGVLKNALVAVRSSATAEDLPTASFAGQQETFLNVCGEANLVESIRQAWASLFTTRAIFYRHENKFDHLRVGLATVVQKMVESETSGVMFTLDPVTNDKNAIVIEAIYGLGELIVQGAVTPDHYELDKKTLEVEVTSIEPQKMMLVKQGTINKKVEVAKNLTAKQKLTTPQIKQIADLGRKLEHHYYFPQDVEWAIEKGKIYIVQTRPVTTIGIGKLKIEKDKQSQFSTLNSQLLLRGDPASPGIATGPVKVVGSVKELAKVKQGDILVTPKTNPDYVTAMKRAAGIITDTGGRTSHAAIVSRELGIPAVVGTDKGTRVLKNEMIVTINGTTGEVFAGSLLVKNAVTPVQIVKKIKTATKLYVNLSDPKVAAEVAKHDVDGVGLLRAEFMIAQIGTHPKKLIEEKKEKKFINYLADGLRTFCESFNPRPVVYRATDFKTNEYRNLSGGRLFEPMEENPMLGYRGAYRYISDERVFNMELEAIKIVRQDLNLHNLYLMIPFIRTVGEFVKVRQIVAQSKLLTDSKFRLWMMVEVPSNVILIEQFLKAGVDGVSIGSNDLTMLTLGVDRDNNELQSSFDERNPAVAWSMERVIKAATRLGITSSICGQAPAVYPELVEKLVEWGISSISVTPDAILQTRQYIKDAEEKVLKKR